MDISFVIPMYNAAPYIEKLYATICAQGLDNSDYEVVIVNDGSTDDSPQIAQRIAAAASNVVVINQPNAGQGAARNRGAAAARGTYLYYVDSDDELFPNVLGQATTALKSAAADIIAFAGDEQSACASYSGVDYVATHNYNNGPWWYAIKKEFQTANRIDFEEGRYCEDGMFTMTALLKARAVMAYNLKSYNYILRPNSTVTRRDHSHMLKMIDDFEYALEYFRQQIDSVAAEVPTATTQRCVNRLHSYVFFLLARVIKASIPIKDVNALYSRLRHKGYIPVKLAIEEYPSMKFRLLNFCFSHRLLYLTVRRLHNMLRS